MPLSHYHRTRFVKSIGNNKQIPKDNAFEVAFVGRSNAGKSSALNTLTNQTKLAKISRTPGRTQLINYFQVDEHKFLVDLPGYGYAKAAQGKQAQWQQLINDYMHDRSSLKGIVLIMDIRHPLTPLDIQLLIWAHNQKKPVHALLTKSDKAGKNIARNTEKKVKQAMVKLHPDSSVQLFSSLKKIGVNQLAQQLDNWLALT